MTTVIIILTFLAASIGGAAGSAAGPQTRPDFSGAWVFDLDKSTEPTPDGRIVIAAMLGDEFVAEQDARSLTLTIRASGQTVKAVYALDGSESRNISPGDIPVLSKAFWQGEVLVIDSRSISVARGEKLTIETRRVMYLDENGLLILERTGVPESEVTPSRSVYRRKK